MDLCNIGNVSHRGDGLPEKSCVCCQEMDLCKKKIDDDGVDCITEHQNFEAICVLPDALRTAIAARNDMRRDTMPDPIPNK